MSFKGGGDRVPDLRTAESSFVNMKKKTKPVLGLWRNQLFDDERYMQLANHKAITQ
jgi:hypothetical protein